MTIADDIMDLVKRKRRLRLTALDIADILYWGDKTYRTRVAASCKLLYEQGSLARDGAGTPADPYTYSRRSDEGAPAK
jgi:hypothetical protein